jgi:hypothetical protein
MLINSKEDVLKITQADRKRSFAEWMEQPFVRFTISQIPSGEASQQEALKILLQSAFDAGHSAGQGVVLMSMVEHIFADKRKPPP